MVSVLSSAVGTLEGRSAMRRHTDGVGLDHDERSLSSTTPALLDFLQAARAVCDAVTGLGPLQRRIDAPEVEGIAAVVCPRRSPEGALSPSRSRTAVLMAAGGSCVPACRSLIALGGVLRTKVVVLCRAPWPHRAVR